MVILTPSRVQLNPVIQLFSVQFRFRLDNEILPFFVQLFVLVSVLHKVCV